MESMKFFRYLRGKSQFQLSLETRIPSYRLSRLENGKVEPSTEELARLALALGTSPEQLVKQIHEEMLSFSGIEG